MYKKYEGKNYNKLCEVLSTMEKKTNIVLIEKNKDMLEKPDFEQDYYSRTEVSIYKIGHDRLD